MNEKQKYFMKQRLIGTGVVIGTIAFVIFTGEATIAFLTVPMGLTLMFSKERLWT